jgi:hypothetical protein
MEGTLKRSDSNEEDQKMSAQQEQQREDPSSSATTDLSIAAPAKKTRKKDKNKPKRPLSAYNLFFKDERLRYLKEEEEHPSGPKDKFLNMSREIGRRWMNLSSERRKIYEALAEEAMFRYRVSMDAYKARKQLEETAATQLLAQQQPAVARPAPPDRTAFASAFQQYSLENTHKSTAALESFLLANQATHLPTGALPMHMLQSAASRELLHRPESSSAETNLLNYLLLEKLAQSRERAEDATTMRLNALLQARAPHERPPTLDARWLYDNRMLPTAPSIPMNQAPNRDLREQRKQELLEFVRQQQNPQWMELLNPENQPNPHGNPHRKF